MKNTKKGGSVKPDNIFRYIKSIGFEIETIDIVKFNIKQHDDKEILINTKVSNDQHFNYCSGEVDEFGDVIDELDEYVDIIVTDKEVLDFKITNDCAPDTHLNEEIEKIGDATDCDESVFKLSIPKNSYLTQDEYDIKFRDACGNLVNCEIMSDVEWIITHYKINSSPNIILETFSKSMLLLREHLNELITIPNSHLLYLDEDDDFVRYENTSVNQVYVLPNKSVLYFNSIYTNTDRGELRAKNYDITQDLEIVVQMTFGCDILYIYRIMKKLLSVDFTPANLEKIRSSFERNPGNKNIKMIDDLIRNIENGESVDLQIITNTLNIVKIMFENYNKTSKYPFPSNEITKKIQMYFFLIFYKIYIYLNFYLTDKDPEVYILKKLSSFMVRHANYFLYLEIKKLLGQLFPDKSGRDILKIIEKLLVPLDKNKNLKPLFVDEFMHEKTKEIYMNMNRRYSRSSKSIGDPLYSISEYFANFEGNGSEEKRDWLVRNNVDGYSAKYPLYDNTVIVEFRDFPTFCYMQLLIEVSDESCDELLALNVGTFNMKNVNEFIDGKKSKPKTRKLSHATTRKYPRTYPLRHRTIKKKTHATF